MDKDRPKGCQNYFTTNFLSKLYKDKPFSLAAVQGERGNRTQTRTNTKVIDPNNMCVDVLANLKHLCIKKSKETITRYGQYWWWLPKHKMGVKFDDMYMKHPYNKHDEWELKKKRKR